MSIDQATKAALQAPVEVATPQGTSKASQRAAWLLACEREQEFHRWIAAMPANSLMQYVGGVYDRRAPSAVACKEQEQVYRICVYADLPERNMIFDAAIDASMQCDGLHQGVVYIRMLTIWVPFNMLGAASALKLREILFHVYTSRMLAGSRLPVWSW